jgi:hypothetical protein
VKYDICVPVLHFQYVVPDRDPIRVGISRWSGLPLRESLLGFVVQFGVGGRKVQTNIIDLNAVGPLKWKWCRVSREKAYE